MDDKFEKLGQLIDRVDSLAHALQIPLPADMHVSSIRSALPEIVAELKASFVELTNENPWE